MGVLGEIIDNKRRELVGLRKALRPTGFSPRPVTLARDVDEPPRLITEIKRRSPSAGALSTALSVGERAAAYEAAGASMISVLCDEKYFGGSYEHLGEARRACSLPLLCKEFVIDSVQLDMAAAHGADAVLLIVRCLPPDLLSQLIVDARERQLTPLVEVHDSAECRIALDAGAELIGVNARNLDTLEMDVAGAQQVLASLPEDSTAVHLSGVSSPADVAKIAATRADAILLGEALMRLDDPKVLLEQMVLAAAAR